MNLYSLKPKYTLALFLLLMLVVACSKERLDFFEDSSILTINHAKQWFNTNSKFEILVKDKSNRFFDFSLQWDQAIEGKTKDGFEYVEVPLISNKDSQLLYQVTPKDDPTKKVSIIIPEKYALVIYSEGTDDLNEVIKDIKPADEYVVRHREHFDKKDFSGSILLMDWAGDVVGGSFFENGIRKGSINPLDPNKGIRKGARTKVEICSTISTCSWRTACGSGQFGTTLFGQTTTSYSPFCLPPAQGTGVGSYDPWECGNWELNYQTQYQECYDDGSTPEHPGEGTGPNYPAPISPSGVGPCDYMTRLKSNEQWRQNMMDLKNSVTHNREYGYAFGPNGYWAIKSYGPVGQGSVNITFAGKIYGDMHSHYEDPQWGLSVFSAPDLLGLADAYQNNYMASVKNYSISVVTPYGTQYTIIVDNVQKFKAWVEYVAPDISTRQAFIDGYHGNPFNINKDFNGLNNEQKLAHYLRVSESGLRLFKGNANMTDWTPITADDNFNVWGYPCN